MQLFMNFLLKNAVALKVSSAFEMRVKHIQSFTLQHNMMYRLKLTFLFLKTCKNKTATPCIQVCLMYIQNGQYNNDRPAMNSV